MDTLPGLFVVGTDTGVGKTRVASAIARSLVQEGRRVGVLKPLATGVDPGNDRGADASQLIAAVGAEIPAERVAPLTYAEPLAPAVAARRRGVRLEMSEVERAVGAALGWWRERADVLVVEGIGGLLTPLAEGATLADLAIRLDYPLLIVARRGLGTLNHTLLTIEAARLRGLRVAGIVLNASPPAIEGEALAEATNAEELARRLDGFGIAILAEIPFSDRPDAVFAILRTIDWSRRALSPRGEPEANQGRGVVEPLSRIYAEPDGP